MIVKDLYYTQDEMNNTRQLTNHYIFLELQGKNNFSEPLAIIQFFIRNVKCCSHNNHHCSPVSLL